MAEAFSLIGLSLVSLIVFLIAYAKYKKASKMLSKEKNKD